MNSRFALLVPLALFSLVFITVAPAFADPLPGEVAKFAQLPLNGGLPISVAPLPVPIVGTPAPFPGHDELSTAYFNPNQPSIVHWPIPGRRFRRQVHDARRSCTMVGFVHEPNAALGTVPAFNITFESDVPSSQTGGPSHPGTPLLSQIVLKGALAPASGTFTETPLPVAAGNPDGNLFLYNAELALPFRETPDTVFWLKIVALDPTHVATDPARIQWGWHDRDWGLFDPLASTPPALVPGPGEHDESSGTTVLGPVWHFQDDAVGGGVSITAPTLVPGASASVVQTGFTPESYVLPFDGPPGGPPLSKDLSFVLYTVPEPCSLTLLGLGGIALCVAGLRRRSAN